MCPRCDCDLTYEAALRNGRIMQETSRNKLLRALLHAREPLHVRQLKTYLGTSTNAVYKQVNALEHQRFIERGENIPTKGRPGRLYQLTSKGRSSFLKQYVLFANLIVDELKNCLTSCQVQKYFSKLGQTLASNFMYRVDHLEKIRKIKEVEVIMQDLGYEASSIS